MNSHAKPRSREEKAKSPGNFLLLNSSATSREKQMKRIRPEDRGMNLPARLGANLAQHLDEALAIRSIHEDPFAPVTAIHDVINRASLLDSQLAAPAGRTSQANIKN